MFTDIVGSTESRRGWAIAAGVTSSSGTTRPSGSPRPLPRNEVDTAGDGFFATFDGPARAVRCAEAIVEAVRRLGMEVRAGIHTGEVETINGKVGGMAVEHRREGGGHGQRL